MKNRKTLLTHAAVFGCGAALAFVSPRQKAADSTAVAGAPAGRVSSMRSGQTSASGTESKSAALRERRETGDTPSSHAKEPAAVRLEAINRIGDPLERQEALMELINRLGPAEFAEVAGQYRDMEHFGNSRGEFDMILRGWAKADPLGALEYASTGGDSRDHTAVVLSAWAGHDAAAAERWALDHHEGEGANPHLAAVIRGIAIYDITRAAQLAASMPSSRERGEAMESITRALFVQGAEVAMNYTSTIQDPQLRAGYVSMVAGRLASRDAEKAAAWLASMPDVDAQNGAARQVAQALAVQDVAKAADWVRSLSPAAQAEAARGVIQPMSSSDIPGTAKWVATLSGIPNYDRVVEEFVWSCDQRSPEQSAAWIQGISDPAQQARLYHRMLGEWARRDPAAVKNWVATNNVPNSVAQRFKR